MSVLSQEKIREKLASGEIKIEPSPRWVPFFLVFFCFSSFGHNCNQSWLELDAHLESIEMFYCSEEAFGCASVDLVRLLSSHAQTLHISPDTCRALPRPPLVTQQKHRTIAPSSTVHLLCLWRKCVAFLARRCVPAHSATHRTPWRIVVVVVVVCCQSAALTRPTNRARRCTTSFESLKTASMFSTSLKMST